MSACTCVGVAMGSYANQETVITPWGRRVGIDRCILPDLRALWAAGVRTIESCCGHGLARGYIAVPPEHERAMIARGFTIDERTASKGCFLWPR